MTTFEAEIDPSEPTYTVSYDPRSENPADARCVGYSLREVSETCEYVANPDMDEDETKALEERERLDWLRDEAADERRESR